MVGLELFGEDLGGGEPLGRVGLGEDEGQSLVDDRGQLLWQVPLEVAPLVQVRSAAPLRRRRTPS